MSKTIGSFDGKYRFLSNFFPCAFMWNGVIWTSVEHAFQAMKTRDRRVQENIRLLPTAYKAKLAGKRLKLRSDWDQVRVPYMQKFVDLKFAYDSELGRKLLATGDTELIEGNTWGDTFWGQCNGAGANQLGLCLMKRRDVLRKLEREFATQSEL